MYRHIHTHTDTHCGFAGTVDGGGVLNIDLMRVMERMPDSAQPG